MQHHAHYSLKDHNTLKIDVSCKQFYLIEHTDEIHDFLVQHPIGEEPCLILGEGANVLFTQNFEGTVLQLATASIDVHEDAQEHIILKVDAGVHWHDLVKYAVSNNLGGIENMALIPGKVGAAAIGNIAAYGQNFSDVCDGVVAIELASGTIKTYTSEECEFTYRDSIFKKKLKDKFFIVSVFVKLNKNPEVNTEYWSKKHGSVGEILAQQAQEPYSIEDVMNAIIQLRTEKFPDMEVLGTAGSFYKNPVVSKEKFDELSQKVPNLQYYPIEGLQYVDNTEKPDEMVKIAAGDILDNGMGYKGLWIGNVGLFEKHALVLVTNGQATGQEVLAFAEKIEKDFYEFCGIQLEREVITI